MAPEPSAVEDKDLRFLLIYPKLYDQPEDLLYHYPPELTRTDAIIRGLQATMHFLAEFAGKPLDVFVFGETRVAVEIVDDVIFAFSADIDDTNEAVLHLLSLLVSGFRLWLGSYSKRVWLRSERIQAIAEYVVPIAEQYWNSQLRGVLALPYAELSRQDSRLFLMAADMLTRLLMFSSGSVPVLSGALFFRDAVVVTDLDFNTTTHVLSVAKMTREEVHTRKLTRDGISRSFGVWVRRRADPKWASAAEAGAGSGSVDRSQMNAQRQGQEVSENSSGSGKGRTDARGSPEWIHWFKEGTLPEATATGNEISDAEDLTSVADSATAEAVKLRLSAVPSNFTVSDSEELAFSMKPVEAVMPKAHSGSDKPGRRRLTFDAEADAASEGEEGKPGAERKEPDVDEGGESFVHPEAGRQPVLDIALDKIEGQSVGSEDEEEDGDEEEIPSPLSSERASPTSSSVSGEDLAASVYTRALLVVHVLGEAAACVLLNWSADDRDTRRVCSALSPFLANFEMQHAIARRAKEEAGEHGEGEAAESDRLAQTVVQHRVIYEDITHECCGTVVPFKPVKTREEKDFAHSLAHIHVRFEDAEVSEVMLGDRGSVCAARRVQGQESYAFVQVAKEGAEGGGEKATADHQQALNTGSSSVLHAVWKRARKRWLEMEHVAVL